MKKLLFTISLLITMSNIAFARERIKNDPNAHIKPTYSTEIESVEIVPTVVHMSETEEIIMETAATTIEESSESLESSLEETTIDETQIVIPEVEDAFVDNKIYTSNDLPTVGYAYKDTDDPGKAFIESIQGVTNILSLIPISSGVRITYRSDINGWAEFDVTYNTVRGGYTNTVIKPIYKGLNILTLSTSQSDSVSYFQSPNVFCSAIRRIIMSE